MLPRRKELGLNLVDDFFDDFFASPFFLQRKGTSEFHTDIVEEDNQYLLDMNLPGFKKEEIKVSVEDGYVTIEAKTSTESENNETKGYLIKERYEGECKRSFYIGDVQDNQIKASFENGKLSLTIPKQPAKEIENKKYIEIQ